MDKKELMAIVGLAIIILAAIVMKSGDDEED